MGGCVAAVEDEAIEVLIYLLVFHSDRQFILEHTRQAFLILGDL